MHVREVRGVSRILQLFIKRWGRCSEGCKFVQKWDQGVLQGGYYNCVFAGIQKKCGQVEVVMTTYTRRGVGGKGEKRKILFFEYLSFYNLSFRAKIFDHTKEKKPVL